MKKNILLIFLFFVFYTLSASTDFIFSLAPVYEFKSGTYYEYVLAGKDLESAEKESQLSWDMNGIFQLGLQGGFDISGKKHSFSMEVYSLWGFRSPQGKIHDYDWNMDTKVINKYSCHENNLDFSLKAGLMAKWTNFFGLSILFGYEFNQYDFVAKGGYAQHTDSQWDESSEITYVYSDNEEVIRYTPKNSIIKIGLGYEKQLKNFLLEFNFWYCPFVYSSAIDYHLLSYSFLDLMKGWEGYGGNLSFSWQFVPNSKLILSLQGEYIPLFAGKTYKKWEEEQLFSILPNNLGGCSWNTYSISLSYRLAIF